MRLNEEPGDRMVSSASQARGKVGMNCAIGQTILVAGVGIEGSGGGGGGGLSVKRGRETECKGCCCTSPRAGALRMRWASRTLARASRRS